MEFDTTAICLFETFTPLGRPVVPDVKMIENKSSPFPIISNSTSSLSFKSSIQITLILKSYDCANSFVVIMLLASLIFNICSIRLIGYSGSTGIKQAPILFNANTNSGK